MITPVGGDISREIDPVIGVGQTRPGEAAGGLRPRRRGGVDQELKPHFWAMPDRDRRRCWRPAPPKPAGMLSCDMVWPMVATVSPEHCCVAFALVRLIWVN